MNTFKKCSGYFVCFFSIILLVANMDTAYSAAWLEGKILLSGRDFEVPAPFPFSLYIMNADGSGYTKIRDIKVLDGEYTFSPDFKSILFNDVEPDVRDPSPGHDVYIMDIDGGNKINLTNTADVREYRARWSPDGQQIVYTKRNQFDVRAVHTMDKDGRAAREIRDGTSMDWSRKDMILFRFDDDLWSMRPNGKERRNLTNNELPGRPFNARWSPDGSSIVFECQRDIYTMDEDGHNLRNLTDSEFIDYRPLWSPNGERIAFGSNGVDGEYRVYVIDINGDNMQILADKKKNILDWGSESPFAVAPVRTSKITAWGDIKRRL